MIQLPVDFVSGIVCPWCALGYYRPNQASADLDVALEIHRHLFELNPQMPGKGIQAYPRGCLNSISCYSALNRLKSIANNSYGLWKTGSIIRDNVIS